MLGCARRGRARRRWLRYAALRDDDDIAAVPRGLSARAEAGNARDATRLWSSASMNCETTSRHASAPPPHRPPSPPHRVPTPDAESGGAGDANALPRPVDVPSSVHGATAKAPPARDASSIWRWADAMARDAAVAVRARTRWHAARSSSPMPGHGTMPRQYHSLARGHSNSLVVGWLAVSLYQPRRLIMRSRQRGRVIASMISPSA